MHTTQQRANIQLFTGMRKAQRTQTLFSSIRTLMNMQVTVKKLTQKEVEKNEICKVGQVNITHENNLMVM